MHGKGFHQALRGRARDGSFMTAQHKVYPPLLNDVIAEAVIEFIQALDPDQPPQTQLPLDFEPFVSDIFAADGVVQPDYHGMTDH